MPGPQRTPTVLQKLHGNPNKRPLPEAEPQAEPVKGLPPAPEFLSKAARPWWDTLGGLAVQMKTLSNYDLPALAVLCEDYASMVGIREFLAVNGRYQAVETKAGGLMERLHPAVGDLSDTTRRVLQQLASFGLNPSARGKVSVVDTGAEVQDEFDL